MHTFTLWRIQSAKLAWLSTLFVLLLSRTPVLRVLVSTEFAVGPRLGEMLRALVPVALAAGAVNTMTGATQFTSNPASPAPATVNEPFNMVFAVTGAPSTTKCYSIDGALPDGLSVPNAIVSGTNRTLNASNGSITGTPTESGTFTVAIKAWEKASRGGKSTSSYNVTIQVSGPAATAPTFTSQPSSLTVTAGGSATFTVAASGTPAPTLQWRKDGANLTGKTGTTLTLSAVSASDAGSYACVATNAAGSVTSNPATLTVNPATVAPTFTTQPASQETVIGGSVTFTVAASGTPAPTLQWRFAGAALNGQTGSSLTINGVQAQHAGNYDCVATNAAGSATSQTATLTVGAPSAPVITSQPTPMASRTGTGAYFSVMAEGPGLSYQWFKNGNAIAGATNQAFSIAATQASDAGTYSVVVTNATGQSTTSDAATLTVPTTGSAHLLNLSSRAGVGSVSGSLIPGLVISGDVSLTLLVRAVGPGLIRHGVPNAIADPMITIFRGPTAIAQNDDWEQAPDVAALSECMNVVGAFPLAAGSTDAALLISLQPGIYTVHVTGKSGITGEALAEIYVVE